jgi:uncharacterized protein
MTTMRTLLASAALTIVAGLTAAEAATPTFGCKGRLNAAERAICGSHRLADLDRRLSRQYWALHAALPRADRKALRKDQRAWLAVRNGCGDSEYCLESEYLDRMSQLADWD